jgi:hypothetical protein
VLREAEQDSGVDVLHVVRLHAAEMAPDHLPRQRRRLALDQVAEQPAGRALVGGFQERQKRAIDLRGERRPWLGERRDGGHHGPKARG